MDFLIFWLSNVPGFATPFALGVLGTIICERSGVLNLGAEGFVLVGAMSGAGVLISVGDLPLFALVIAGLSGSIFGLFGDGGSSRHPLHIVCLRVGVIDYSAGGRSAHTGEWRRLPGCSADLGAARAAPAVCHSWTLALSLCFVSVDYAHFGENVPRILSVSEWDGSACLSRAAIGTVQRPAVRCGWTIWTPKPN